MPLRGRGSNARRSVTMATVITPTHRAEAVRAGRPLQGGGAVPAVSPAPGPALPPARPGPARPVPPAGPAGRGAASSGRHGLPAPPGCTGPEVTEEARPAGRSTGSPTGPGTEQGEGTRNWAPSDT